MKLIKADNGSGWIELDLPRKTTIMSTHYSAGRQKKEKRKAIEKNRGYKLVQDMIAHTRMYSLQLYILYGSR